MSIEYIRKETAEGAICIGYQRELLTEIDRLQEERLQDLHQFLNEQRPKIDGSGWLTRDILRRTILDFLAEFEAAGAKGK